MTDAAPTSPIEAGETPGTVRRRRPMTLRTKLIGASVLLVLLVCGVIGVTTEVSLGRYLTKQIDEQLIDYSKLNYGGPPGAGYTPARPEPGSATIVDGCAGNEATSGRGNRGPGAPSNLSARIVDGQVTYARVVASDDTCVTLSPAAQQTLLSLVGTTKPVTVDVDGFGEARVLAKTNIDGSTTIGGVELNNKNATQSQLLWTLLIVMASALVIATIGAYLIIRRTLRPLDRVAATARKVSTMPLHRGEVDLSLRVPEQDTDPRTEVGQVGSALNQMLGHVSTALERRQASEMQVRRFVADASHELRTPLAAIRGYTELARRGDADTDTVTHALARVDSESIRMSALVDDLLLLARLDAGRPLAQEEVDLTLLAMDVVSDAKAAGPEHVWQLDLPEEPISVTGDEPRLHQVLANLLSNARTHTPAGTTVTTGVAEVNGEVRLTVSDNGPGIDKSLLPGIFGRFVRGDSSRSRHAGSTGLGLAIVRAVVSAHSGTVTAESSPGQTTFTVRLAPHHGNYFG